MNIDALIIWIFAGLIAVAVHYVVLFQIIKKAIKAGMHEHAYEERLAAPKKKGAELLKYYQDQKK